MPRRKIIPDSEVFTIIRNLIAAEGEKAASFGAISRATGLAAATLAQRYQSQEAMVRAAVLAGWDIADARAEAADADTERSAKGIAALLKATHSDLSLLHGLSMRDPQCRARAIAWRQSIENALTLRLGGGAKAQETAAIVFASWQGQVLWQQAGDKGFRLKELLKRLG